MPIERCLCKCMSAPSSSSVLNSTSKLHVQLLQTPCGCELDHIRNTTHGTATPGIPRLTCERGCDLQVCHWLSWISHPQCFQLLQAASVLYHTVQDVTVLVWLTKVIRSCIPYFSRVVKRQMCIIHALMCILWLAV